MNLFFFARMGDAKLNLLFLDMITATYLRLTLSLAMGLSKKMENLTYTKTGGGGGGGGGGLFCLQQCILFARSTYSSIC